MCLRPFASQHGPRLESPYQRAACGRQALKWTRACVRGAGVAIKNVSVHGVFLCRVLVGKAPSVYKHEDAEITVNSVSGALGWVAVDKRECCVVCVHACVVAPSSRERQAV
jgi:hypothetical protein